MFESVSILFSDVVTFTEICSRISPMEVVSMLNGMYSIFDKLTERNRVYKVETIGDAYMVVSGAPEKEGNHAERVCDMALDMVDAITDLKDPSTGQHLRIRVGVHSGAVVAGIVGLKMPRYCLFGDSVNTASRMESTSEAMKIHISQYTRELIPPPYRVMERGEIQIKGKGTMKTYWLQAKECRVPVPRNADVVPPSNDIERIPDFKETNQSIRQPMEMARSVVYSPITFQDVARRSIASSPIKSNLREMRSNSAGAVYSICNPADLFGSIVLEQHEETDSDFPMNLPSNFRNRCTTAPPRTLNKQEVSLTPQGSPLSPLASSPAILVNNHINHASKEKKVEVDPGSISSNSKKNLASAKPKIEYEFGKSMYNYAKKLENKYDINHKAVITSKSEGSLCDKKDLNNISNSRSEYFKQNQHQQCCSGFGSSTRTRYQSSGCIIF